MSNWNKYNQNLIESSIKFLEENNQSIFNLEEKRCYSHIRDLVAFLAAVKDKELNILDYGSNIMPWSNIKNKIDVKSLSVTVFDPYSLEDYSKGLNFDFPLKVINNLSSVNNELFDILIFGSSSQYIEDFYKKFLDLGFVIPEMIFFTDTPLSLKNELHFQQVDQSGSRYKVFIRTFSRLKSFMHNLGYSIIFKSALPWETQEYLPYELSDKIKITNILFKKIS